MSARMVPEGVTSGGRIVAVLLGLLLAAGCDMGMDSSANRYEQLNKETKELIALLRQVKDEATANEHLDELKGVAGRVADIQQRIIDSAASGKSGGAGLIANHRQATLYAQAAENVANQLQRLREDDPKAADIVTGALEGCQF